MGGDVPRATYVAQDQNRSSIQNQGLDQPHIVEAAANFCQSHSHPRCRKILNVKHPKSQPSVHVIDGFDIVTLWLDRPELPMPERRLWPHCSSVDITCYQPKYQANRKLLVRLHQPTAGCLKVLRSGIGREVGVAITSAEIARDVTLWPTSTVPSLQDAFLGSVRVPYQRDPVVEHKGTWYYGRRTSNAKAQEDDQEPPDLNDTSTAVVEHEKKGRRQGHVLAVYADKPSKQNNARPDETEPPCLHIEWRASGKAALEHLGIRALDDLLCFDFDRHWDARIRLHSMPTKTALGRLLAKVNCGSEDSSGTAYRKRANRWLANYEINGQFVLHNALQDERALGRKLTRITWNEWLQESGKSLGITP